MQVMGVAIQLREVLIPELLGVVEAVVDNRAEGLFSHGVRDQRIFRFQHNKHFAIV